MTFPHLSTLALAACALGLACCILKPDGEPCSTELRFNFCVTVNGQQEFPDSLLVIRAFASHSDTINGRMDRPHPFPPGGNCFPENHQASTLRAVKGDQVLAEMKVGRIGVVDVCHSVDTTVNLTLPKP